MNKFNQMCSTMEGHWLTRQEKTDTIW
jgi:hypothetical protein